jgi:hypothetical protein
MITRRQQETYREVQRDKKEKETERNKETAEGNK